MSKANFHILRSGFVVGSNPCHDDAGKFCSTGGGRISFSSAKGVKKEEFNSWEGLRRGAGEGALIEIKQGAKGIVIKDGSEVRGIVALKDKPGHLVVSVMGTKEKGYGAKLMQEVCRTASQSNKGVTLLSIPSARSFYEAIGMMMGEYGRYTFTRQEAANFAKRKL